jgi:hypothetical protein
MTNEKNKKTAEPEIVLTAEQVARYNKEIEDYKALRKAGGKQALRKAGYIAE